MATTDEAQTTSEPQPGGAPPATAPPTRRTTPIWLRVVLWMMATLLMFSAVVYQRLTGPTHPFRGSYSVQGESYRYRLLRSQETSAAARISLPSAAGRVTGTLHQKRFRTDDPFTEIAMAETDGVLAADLPIQPAAGKIEYFLTLDTPDGAVRIPEEGSDNIVLRYKDPVPGYILWPHVLMMFSAVFCGMYAGLAALFAPASMRFWAWFSLGCMSLGGMVLGPIVQKYAFGAYWTGFPWGGDWTDNKMLVMWVAWLIACVTIGFGKRDGTAAPPDRISRAVLFVATIVMVGVYLIPHSMGGSELDYEAIEEGKDPKSAVTTGRV